MIRGSLDHLHFGDLLQWFQMGGVSGRLSLKGPRGERRLDFKEGRVCYVSSTIAEERLASWLARRTMVPRAELRRLLAQSMLRRALFTDLLVAEGLIGAAELQVVLTDLAETITSRLLAAAEVEFEFDPAHPVLDTLGLSLSAQPNRLLMEAARRTDEYTAAAPEDAEHELPLAGDAFESLFWELVRDGVSGDEPLTGDELKTLHDLVRDIVRTLAQWLACSPGLVPVPARQLAELGRAAADGEPVGLFGLAHSCWNQMVFARAVHDGADAGPGGLAELEQVPAGLDVRRELAGAPFLKRPDAPRLDGLVQQVVVAWTRAAGAAAPHLGVDPGAAALAVHLVVVPTDLVLWVLATLPVPHRNLRRALLERLPRRLGASLGRLADFPKLFCEVLEPLRATPLGVCLQLGRATLPTTGPWPRTVPGDDRDHAGVASATALALAADAARQAVSEIGADTLAAG
jgi:hypothetical protein